MNHNDGNINGNQLSQNVNQAAPPAPETTSQTAQLAQPQPNSNQTTVYNINEIYLISI
jgi:hypothetical protein